VLHGEPRLLGYIAAVRAAFCSFVVVVVVVVVAGCVEDPPPDEGCPFGGDASAGCAFAWQDACAGSDEDGCVGGSAVKCDVDDATAVPTYDCHACGCGGTDACVDVSDIAVCLSADEREGARDEAVVDDGLDDEEYVALFRKLLRDPAVMTRDEAVQRLRERRAEDPRRSVVLVGTDAGDGVNGFEPFVFAEVDDGSFGDVHSEASCGDVDVGALEDANDGAVFVDDADAVTAATCRFPGVFPRCAPPSLASCAEAKGALPETFVIVGRPSIIALDNALLRKATRAGHDQWSVRLDAQLELFSDTFSHPPSPGLVDDVVSGEVRFLVDDVDEEVVFVGAFAPVGPLQLSSFRLMWNDGIVGAFLLEHDITPDECAFEVFASEGDVVASVGVDCQKNGASITGAVVPGASDLSQLVLTAP
jgi:hypothetical protein